MRQGAGFWIGVWAGAVLVTLIEIAVDTSYYSELLGDGVRLKAGSIILFAVIGALVGGTIGAICTKPESSSPPAKQPEQI